MRRAAWLLLALSAILPLGKGQGLVSRIDYGGFTVEFLALDPTRTMLRNVEFCLDYQARRRYDPKSLKPEDHARYRTDCPAHEWTAPFWPEDQTRLLGRDLRTLWRRVEERTWWRAETQVNMAIPFAARNDYLYMCILGMGDWFKSLYGIVPETPFLRTHVLREHTGAGFWPLRPKALREVPPNPALSFQGRDPEAKGWDLKRYLGQLRPGSASPRVDAREFCDSSGWGPFFWIPGVRYTMWVFGVQVLDIEIPFNWPRPIYFPYGEPPVRLARALAHASARYQADYWMDLLTRGYRPQGRPTPEALPLPVRLPRALWWRDLREGAVVQPVSGFPWEDAGEKLRQFVQLARKVAEGGYTVRVECPTRAQGCVEDGGRWWKDAFDLRDLNAYAYYAQPLTRSPTLDAYLVPGFDFKRDDKGPGIWRLEEAKRWLPYSLDPLNAERQGVVTLSQAWGQWDTVNLGLILFHGYATWTITETPPLPPRTWTIPVPWEYPAGAAVISGVRVHFGWVNVPEGYGVPRTVGVPR